MPRKKQTPRLPLEIWQIILRYSISVLDFLDPDEGLDRFPPWVVAKRGWSKESSYYEAERTRNALRRVCRSWNEYLQQYAHRFVRIKDVLHGNVPMQYLQTAKRISLGDYGHHDEAFCIYCKHKEFIPPPYWYKFNYSSLCGYILQSQSPLRVETLDYGVFASMVLAEANLSQIFPKLVRFQAMNVTMELGETIKMIESLPSLRHIYVELAFSSYEIPKIKSLTSSTLTTLYLSSYGQTYSPLTTLERATIYLPALRHLRFDHVQFDEDQEPDWLPLVKIVGKELLSLYLPSNSRGSDVPAEIWRLCPKLEDLDGRFISPPSTPPVGHPIHTLGVSKLMFDGKQRLEELLSDWPSLLTIRVDTDWHYWKDGSTLPWSSVTEWLAFRGLSMRDMMGELMTE
jgi:hypothetical protein